jgi:hypothetical protein
MGMIVGVEGSGDTVYEYVNVNVGVPVTPSCVLVP